MSIFQQQFYCSLICFTMFSIAASAGAETSIPKEAIESASSGSMEEIVVTAQKRQQSLLDVGISISVANEEAIRDQRITGVTDISMFTPNANVKETVPGLMPIITVRGVGLNDFNAANNPTTGVYVDEVSLSSLALLSSDFFDLERMEVLKGPQGTLYGRNSTAGALNIVTAKPNLSGFDARFSGSVGDYNLLEVDGMVNAALSDSAALRVAFKKIDQGEGYWENRTSGDDVGQRDVTMLRTQLLWEASDNAEILFKLEKLRGRSELGSAEFFGVVPTAAEANCPGKPGCANFLGYSDVDSDPYKGDWSIDPDYDLNETIATIKAEVDLDFATLTSVTGYIDFDRSYVSDVDASPMRILDFTNTDDVRQLSQEIRLAGETEQIVWQAGLFYSRDEVKTTYSGELQALLNTTTFTGAKLDANSKALFINVEWSLAEDWTLITGLRATKEEKSMVGSTIDLVTELPASFFSMTPFGAGPVTLASVDDSISDTSVDWKVGLNWSLADSTLMYMSASRGTKSGGFFTGVAAMNSQLIPYDKETLTAYELGIKGSLSEYGLSYDGSLFYYDYDDIQTYKSDNTGAVPVNRLSNVEGATIYGADLQLRWRSASVDGLSVVAGLGFLNTELESFTSQGTVIPKGNEQPEAPDFSGNIGIRYAFSVSEKVSGQFAVDGQYQSEVFHNAINTPLLASDAYNVVNARMQFYFSRDVELSIWGKNLADKVYVTQAGGGLALGNGFRVYGAPRTYGVTVTKFFAQ
jgi:iron complex outermembrane receptor protein